MMLTVIVASMGAFALKFTGYVLGEKFAQNPRFRRVSDLMPVGLLAGLIIVQALSNQQQLVLDGRLVGVAVAVILLLRRAPFISVILSAALITAVGRACGWWI